MGIAQKKQTRGRPPSDVTVALSNIPEYLVALRADSAVINAEALGDPMENTAATAKTRREIMQHSQKVGGGVANDIRHEERMGRFDQIRNALRDPRRNLGKLSDSRAAQILSNELGLRSNTLRRDIAAVRKLIGPTS